MVGPPSFRVTHPNHVARPPGLYNHPWDTGDAPFASPHRIPDRPHRVPQGVSEFLHCTLSRHSPQTHQATLFPLLIRSWTFISMLIPRLFASCGQPTFFACPQIVPTSNFDVYISVSVSQSHSCATFSPLSQGKHIRIVLDLW